MNTAESKWNEFSEATMPKDASDIQTQEMKRSFYAGAFSMFNMVMDISDLDEETAAKKLTELDKEVQTYFRSGGG